MQHIDSIRSQFGLRSGHYPPLWLPQRLALAENLVLSQTQHPQILQNQKSFLNHTLQFPNHHPHPYKALMFEPLHVDGHNYLLWSNDINTYLSAEELVGRLTLETIDDVPIAHVWQTLLIIHRHLDTSLKQQYLHIQNPAELWIQLESRSHHEKFIYLPQARADWINLRVLDFPDLLSFNSELHHLAAQLTLCGDTFTEADLIEKTLSTFPPTAQYYHKSIET